jgi:nanoRNase/pAp phosphatase (c-di-AMP/oligoRNAs hydrolase)
VIERGRAVEKFINRYVREMAAQQLRARFEGYDVPIVNAPYLNISELVGELSKGHPFAMGWFQRADGKYQYSLRSRMPEGIDVSELAKKYGGGGHKHAAGFTLEMPLVTHVP